MSVYLADTFTTPTDQQLTGHTPEVGGAYDANGGTSHYIYGGSGAVTSNSGNLGFNRSAAAAADSHDLYLSWKVKINTRPAQVTQIGPASNIPTAGGGGYGFVAQLGTAAGSDYLTILKSTSGTVAGGALTGLTLVNGEIITIRITDDGSGSPRFRIYRNGGAPVVDIIDSSSSLSSVNKRLGIVAQYNGGSGHGIGIDAILAYDAPSMTGNVGAVAPGTAFQVTLTGTNTRWDIIQPTFQISGPGSITSQGAIGGSGTTCTLDITATTAGTIVITDPVTLSTWSILVANFDGGTIAAGTIGATKISASNVAAASGNGGTITYAWELNPAGAGFSTIAGATGVALSNATTTPNTSYQLRRTATDSANPGSPAYSNVLSFTTGAPLAAGTIPSLTMGITTASVTAPASTGGGPPYSYQWQRRSPAGSGSYMDVTGQTAKDLADTGLTAETEYQYDRITTDAEGTVVTSNAVTGTTGALAPITGISISGPSTGTTGVATTDFTVALTPTGGTITGSVVVSPDAALGSFSPPSVTLTEASQSATFTYTRPAPGIDSITLTNDRGLTNPSARTITISDPSTQKRIGFNSGVVGIAPTAVIFNQSAEVWDGSAFVAVASAPYSYGITLVDDAGVGFYTADFPDAPADLYDVHIYTDSTTVPVTIATIDTRLRFSTTDRAKLDALYDSAGTGGLTPEQAATLDAIAAMLSEAQCRLDDIEFTIAGDLLSGTATVFTKGSAHVDPDDVLYYLDLIRVSTNHPFSVARREVA